MSLGSKITKIAFSFIVLNGVVAGLLLFVSQLNAVAPLPLEDGADGGGATETSFPLLPLPPPPQPLTDSPSSLPPPPPPSSLFIPLPSYQIKSIINKISMFSPMPAINGMIDNSKFIAKELKKIIETPEGSVITKGISTTGILLTATNALTNFVSTSTVFTPSFYEILLSLIRLWGVFLTGLGIKKRIRHWGTVYDSVTKQPLDPAQIIIKDSQGREIAGAITDIDGRYGFLVPPGFYKITAKKTNYSFPSKKIANRTEDEFYNNLYFGEMIEVGKTGEIIAKDIPLDPIRFDWNEFVKKGKTFMKFYSSWDSWFRKISDLFFVIGFIVALAAFVFSPYPYNFVVMIIYLFLLLLRVFGLKPKSFGYIIDKTTGVPLSFAVLKVMMPNSNVEISRKIADLYGRYYCLVPKGRYYLRIEKKNSDGSYSLIYQSGAIDASKNGIIKNKFVV